MKNFNEDTLAEQPVIEWLKELGYEYAFVPEIISGETIHSICRSEFSFEKGGE